MTVIMLEFFEHEAYGIYYDKRQIEKDTVCLVAWSQRSWWWGLWPKLWLLE